MALKSRGRNPVLNRALSYFSEFTWSRFPSLFYRTCQTKLPYYPRSVQVEITTKCNLRCKMCPNQGFKGFKMTDMPIETYKKAIRQSLPELDFVYLWGVGEPLLNPNFTKMAGIAKGVGAKVSFSTNGTMLDYKIARKIVELGVDEVIFSVDSADPGTFEGIRRGAKFDKVIGNLEGLLGLRKELGSKVPRVSMACALMKDNLGSMSKMVELAHRIGVPSVWFQNVISWDDFTSKHSLLSFRKSAAIRKAFDETGKLSGRMGVRVRFPQLEVRGNSACRFPWFGPMNVRWNGTVTLCPWIAYPLDVHFVLKKGKVAGQHEFFEPLVMGDIHKSDLKEIWNNDRYRQVRDFFKRKRQPYPCNLCLHQYQVIC